MKKHFYSHIVHLDDVYYEIEALEIAHEEKHHLTTLVDSTVHHTVIDVILTELHEDDKKVFMTHLHKDQHSELLELVRGSIFEAERKIIEAVDELKQHLHGEIRKTKSH